MSVVNDVLRDLDERKNNENNRRNLSFIFHGVEPSNNKQNKYLFLIAFTFLFIISIIYLVDIISIKKNQILETNTILEQTKDFTSIKKSKYIEPKENIKTNSISVEKDNKHKIKVDINAKNINESLNLSSKDTSLKKSDTKVISKNLYSSSVGDRKTNNHHNSNYDAVIKRVNNPTQEYTRLLTSSPEKILPLIKNSELNFENNPALLALAALGEQKSGKYQSSLLLYERLIQMEPDESKWKVGYAINLDKLNKKEQALPIYQESLKLPGLPVSLKEFVEKRIGILLGGI